MNQTNQDLNTEIEAIKKTQTEGINEMEILNRNYTGKYNQKYTID